MSLLGDDGRGFELARKLEAQGVWREWLGDTLYSTFVPYLTSATTWESFMRADEPKSKSHIHLQLRARSLLFDKASVSLFLPSPSPLSHLNPHYLKLRGDDVYFTLEDGDQRRDGGVGVSGNTVSSKSHSKSAFGVGLRYGESEMENMHQRFRNEELPENWYNLFMEKHKVSRPYRLSFGDRELEKRSPEEMSNYLQLVDKHKRRRVPFKQDQYMGSGISTMESTLNMHPGSVLDGRNLVDDDAPIFPETMFMLNCVPDSALPPIVRLQDDRKIEFHGVLDSLPQTRSSVMIERLGISMEQGGSIHREKNGYEGHRKLLGDEQASQLSRKVVAHMLTKVGFDGATEAPLEVFSQLFRCHVSKLGRTLRVLADSYRKQCSAIELLKMFLQTTGYSNLGILMELVKDGTRNSVQPTQQVHGMQPHMQSHMQSQHQTPLRLNQQMSRQMLPQMQQLMNHGLAFQQQQQQQQMRRRQPPAIRPGIEIDKDRPLAPVKIEISSEPPMDNNAFNAIQSRRPQMQQYQQQQIAAMSNLHAQSNTQLRQMTSLQIPSMQSPNMGVVRAPPVKVEGFQELMGGDTTLKHDSEENKLTSPSGK